MSGGSHAIPGPGRVPAYALPGPTRAPSGMAEDGGAEAEDWMLPLLRQNAIWFCRLRWLVVAVLAAVGVAASLPGRLPPLEGKAIWAFATALILAALNGVFAGMARRLERRPETGWWVRGQLWVQIVADLLVLTVVIYGLGGGMVAVQFMYLFHIILACIVFPAWASLGVVGLAAGLQLASLGVKSMRAPGGGGGISHLSETAVMLVIWLVIWYLASELSRRLRQRDRELARTNHRLEASMAERTAHMLQTTHQLKAPFAAIHAHAQLLLGGHCGELTEAARGVAEKISVRCLALSRQIQEMLQLANLRSKGQDTLPQEEVDLGAMVESAVSRVEPAARQRGITLRRRVRPLRVRGARDHLAMLVDNLLVNAVSYSLDHGAVSVLCCPGRGLGAVISVRDRGIGIPANKLPLIFDDYFRTDEAVRHNRASTGLGLAIVRQVAHETGIGIRVQSLPGWGSRFTAILPRLPATLSKNPSHALPVNRG